MLSRVVFTNSYIRAKHYLEAVLLWLSIHTDKPLTQRYVHVTQMWNTCSHFIAALQITATMFCFVFSFLYIFLTSLSVSLIPTTPPFFFWIRQKKHPSVLSPLLISWQIFDLMDAKARQDCIKEIDLLKVKNQRNGRRHHTLRSVLLRCLSWDPPPQENNWSAPDTVELCVCVRICLGWLQMQGVVVHTNGNINECACVTIEFITFCLCLCACVEAEVLHPSRLLLALFWMPEQLSFFSDLFEMFKAKQQAQQHGNLTVSLMCLPFLPPRFACFIFQWSGFIC